jgi:hypothetical protein
MAPAPARVWRRAFHLARFALVRAWSAQPGKLPGKRTAASAGTRKPDKSLDRIALHAGAEMERGAQHRLTVGVAVLSAAPPPI